MNIFLSAVLGADFTIETIGKITNPITLDWLGKIIQKLIEGCGSIGLGIIVFTLILKLLTLPFDIYSRISTKKNAVMMEKIRPELERLQRQYANNKELYQRKMQELYKKNSYNPLASCLPMIISLVFFFIVIGQFSTYSNYANLQIFCDMSESYENAIDNYPNGEYLIRGEKDLKLNNYGFATEKKEDGNFINKEHNFPREFQDYGFDIEQKEKDGIEVTFGENTPGKLNKVFDLLNAGNLSECEAKTYFKLNEDGTAVKKADGSPETTEGFDEIKDGLAEKIFGHYAGLFIEEEIKMAGSEAAAETFRKADVRFLWVKNIWSKDLPWDHSVKANFSEYGFMRSSGCGAGCKEGNMLSNFIPQVQYEKLTAGLEEEKTKPNGYLILVFLSIGTMLLSQLIMQKQNKTQMELSDVGGANGTAAMSQKMMTWMMPVMFGIFSFMYTASFSIYIIVNSVLSLIMTILINYSVEKHYELLAKKEAENEELRRTGRISQIPAKKEKKKTKEKDNK